MSRWTWVLAFACVACRGAAPVPPAEASVAAEAGPGGTPLRQYPAKDPEAQRADGATLIWSLPEPGCNPADDICPATSRFVLPSAGRIEIQLGALAPNARECRVEVPSTAKLDGAVIIVDAGALPEQDPPGTSCRALSMAHSSVEIDAPAGEFEIQVLEPYELSHVWWLETVRK